MPASAQRHAPAAAIVVSLALGLAPARSRAGAPPSEQPDQPEQPEQPAQPEPPDERGPPPAEPADPAEGTELDQPEVESPTVPSGGGVAGAIVDPDDPNAGRAQSDLEGESLDRELAGVPERLPQLQAAGWWTTFTAVALATTGGVFAGVAEVREDEAERLAYSFDLLEGRATVYGDVADDYQRLLDEGNTYQWVARGFVIAGGVTLVAGIALFAVDGVQRRKAGRTTAGLRLAPGPGGLALRF